MRDLIQLAMGLMLITIGVTDCLDEKGLSLILGFVGGLLAGDALAEILW